MWVGLVGWVERCVEGGPCRRNGWKRIAIVTVNTWCSVKCGQWAGCRDGVLNCLVVGCRCGFGRWIALMSETRDMLIGKGKGRKCVGNP